MVKAPGTVVRQFVEPTQEVDGLQVFVAAVLFGTHSPALRE